MSYKFSLIITFIGLIFSVQQLRAQRQYAEKVRVTLLSTPLAHPGIGEWGFSALIEVDGNKILFDTGLNSTTVLSNAASLQVALKDIKDVVLSHHHEDHCGGLLALRQNLTGMQENSLNRIHVGAGMFDKRTTTNDTSFIEGVRFKAEGMNAKFIEHRSPSEIFPGVWVSGNIPRITNEQNWNPKGQVIDSLGNVMPDEIKEYQALYINTKSGIILITGCGHAGIRNTLKHAAKLFDSPVKVIIGGLHTTGMNEDAISEIGNEMKISGISTLIGAHCTSIYSLWQLKNQLNLPRKDCIVGSIGTVYDSSKGIIAYNISK